MISVDYSWKRVELFSKVSVGDKIFTPTAVSAEPYSTVLVTILQGEIDPLINNLQDVNLTVSSPRHII